MNTSEAVDSKRIDGFFIYKNVTKHIKIFRLKSIELRIGYEIIAVSR